MRQMENSSKNSWSISLVFCQWSQTINCIWVNTLIRASFWRGVVLERRLGCNELPYEPQDDDSRHGHLCSDVCWVRCKATLNTSSKLFELLLIDWFKNISSQTIIWTNFIFMPGMKDSGCSTCPQSQTLEVVGSNPIWCWGFIFLISILSAVQHYW